MPRKSLNIEDIKEEKVDLTFFNMDEEGDETLKALKQSYVTTNYKEETILNLQASLNNNNTSKELKLESYKKYNEALDLAHKNYITGASKLIEESLALNPKDVDILNLKGLLKLLKCDFSKSFESFYTALCYGNNELSRKYVDDLSSEEFKVFLSRYNHSIRFINEDLNHESIQILDNIIMEDPELTEPYVILSLLYDRLNNTKKKECYIEKLRVYDKDNKLLEEKDIINEVEKEVKAVNTTAKIQKKKSKLSVVPIALVLCLVVGVGVYFVQKQKQINTLNSKLTEKEDKLSKKDEELNKVSKKLNEKNNELENKKEKEENTQEKQNNIETKGEQDLYNEAMEFKSAGEYKKAIANFKQIVSKGEIRELKSSATYQTALLSEKIKNDYEAKIYYRKYIYAFKESDPYYNESYYNLGMLYYKEGDLKNAQDTFYDMKKQVPNSMYNNSEVKKILNES